MPLMAAQNGHGPMSDLSPLSGVKRKSNFGAVRSVDDPKRTLGAVRGLGDPYPALVGSSLWIATPKGFKFTASQRKNDFHFCKGRVE
jgi:hypothetical protein